MSRFERPRQGAEVDSEYDLPSDVLADLIARGVAPVQVISNQLNLAVAGTLNLDNTPGYGFALYARVVSTGAKYTNALVNVSVNRSDATQATCRFPCKSGRGFRGAFSKLYLDWPADSSGTYTAYFVIFKSREYPWIGGVEAT